MDKSSNTSRMPHSDENLRHRTLASAETISIRDTSGTADVVLKLMPAPRLVVEAELPLDFFASFKMFADTNPISVQFPNRNVTFDAFLRRVRASDRTKVFLSPTTE